MEIIDIKKGINDEVLTVKNLNYFHFGSLLIALHETKDYQKMYKLAGKYSLKNLQIALLSGDEEAIDMSIVSYIEKGFTKDIEKVHLSNGFKSKYPKVEDFAKDCETVKKNYEKKLREEALKALKEDCENSDNKSEKHFENIIKNYNVDKLLRKLGTIDLCSLLEKTIKSFNWDIDMSSLDLAEQINSLYLRDDQANLLHKLRIARNGFAHSDTDVDELSLDEFKQCKYIIDNLDFITETNYLEDDD